MPSKNEMLNTSELQLTSSLIFKNVTRQDKLKIWLDLSGISYAKLAEMLVVEPSVARRLCKGDSVSPYRWAQLQAVGIPEELLPESKFIPPGPKRLRQAD